MITFHEFKKLSPDEKNEEIMRCLPLLIPLGENIANLKDSMNEALDKITKLEHEYGIDRPNTGSVDDIETSQKQKQRRSLSVRSVQLYTATPRYIR